jgi:AcrR family transcriptional regulator
VSQSVLDATMQLLAERGFRELTMEAIAERAGSSKVTLYRRWPNKAAIVMDACLASFAARVPFPHTAHALGDLRQHMGAFAQVLLGPEGAIVRALIGEGILDTAVSEAFRARWLVPRREEALGVLRRAEENGEIREGLTLEMLLDMFYGPIYYRLLIAHAPITSAFVEELWAATVEGVRKRPLPQR